MFLFAFAQEAVEVLSERLSLRLPEWCDSIPQVLMLLSAAGIEVRSANKRNYVKKVMS